MFGAIEWRGRTSDGFGAIARAGRPRWTENATSAGTTILQPCLSIHQPTQLRVHHRARRSAKVRQQPARWSRWP